MKAILDKYERLLMPGMLVAGLAVDFYTFRAIQAQTALTLLGAYYIAAGLAIAYIHISDRPGVERPRVSRIAHLVAQTIIQFTFGALLSSSLVFYWYSGSVSVSWPLILLLAFLMVSNDVFRHYYSKPVVQIGVYYFTGFSLLSLALPYIFNSISLWMFVYAGILSLVYILFYVAGLARFVLHLREGTWRLFVPVFVIFAGLNALYFLNFIPPIPLSLHEAGVFHSLKKSGSDYVLQAEEETWLESLIPGQVLRLAPGEKAVVFSSIFAPADLNTTIFHDWQRYDESKGEWVSQDRLSYSLAGGRKAGYRGYTLKSSLTPGEWRVDVETQRGQVLGRLRFTVERVDTPPKLVEVIR